MQTPVEMPLDPSLLGRVEHKVPGWHGLKESAEPSMPMLRWCQ
jgi:hypothetical protein